ncbi:hypothetical protein [Klebsiella pneumoniae]|uniref:hypothetical protein n=1 Tax=Klebsiella pneumoniae TaxID=573 RepID=UPI00388D46FD
MASLYRDAEDSLCAEGLLNRREQEMPQVPELVGLRRIRSTLMRVGFGEYHDATIVLNIEAQIHRALLQMSVVINISLLMAEIQAHFQRDHSWPAGWSVRGECRPTFASRAPEMETAYCNPVLPGMNREVARHRVTPAAVISPTASCIRF